MLLTPMPRFFIRMLLTAVIVSSSVAAPEQERSYFNIPPSPRGDLLISKPNLSWSVWGKGDLKVESVSMSLDGEQLDASYDTDLKTVTAKISSRLDEGKHEAVCKVKFDSSHVVEEKWSFVVLPNAKEELPLSEPHQVLIQHRVNQIRRYHGLKPVSVDSALNAAAESHAIYMDTNRIVGHEEEARRPGFTGESPDRRANAFGYYDRNNESVASFQKDPMLAVDRLFDAPYHRVMFLQPGSPDFGSGYASGSACIKFGGRYEDGLVVSPPQGGVGVPRSWDGAETPDPLRNARLRGAVGYPVVIAAYGEHAKTIRLKSAQMYDGRAHVPLLKLHPGNDEYLDAAIVLIPRIPLEASTKYWLKIEYSMNGRPYVKEWSFTTSDITNS